MSANDEQDLAYIEDPYFHPHDSATPSLDECSEYDALDDELESNVNLFDLRQLEIHDTFIPSDDSFSIETEFFYVKKANDIMRTFFKPKINKQVRVTYCDLTKPYLAKLPKHSNFKNFLDFSVYDNETGMAAGDQLPADLSHLTEEEREHQQKVWREELAQIEEEIATLSTVLSAKMRKSAELKRNLGITVWREVSDDINQGIKNIKETTVYQTVETKVGQVTKAVTDAPIYQKTTSLFGGITGNISNKLSQMKQSDSFRSIEERVGSAYENVKTKVVSRSNSQQSLNEDGRSRSGSVVTSPTIPEDKPLM